MSKLGDDFALVTDLDNTLFRMPPLGKEHHLYATAVQGAIQKLGLKMEFNKVSDMAWQSYKQYGSELEVFMRAPYNLPRQALTDDFYVRAIDEFTPFLKPSATLQDSLRRMTADKVVILTNSPAQWAVPVVFDKLALRGLVKPENILASDDPLIKGAAKKNSVIPFKAAQKKLGIPFNKMVMADDKDENLRLAKQLGMKTVLIHWGHPPAQPPKWADYQAPTVDAFINTVISQNSKAPKQNRL